MKDKIPTDVGMTSCGSIAKVHSRLLSKYIDKVGLINEAFFLYNEEVEWSYRFKQTGYKSVFYLIPV